MQLTQNHRVEVRDRHGEGTHESGLVRNRSNTGWVAAVSNQPVQFDDGDLCSTVVRVIEPPFQPRVGDDYDPEHDNDYPVGTRVLIVNKDKKFLRNAMVATKTREGWTETLLATGIKVDVKNLEKFGDETAQVLYVPALGKVKKF